jgi:hypothetical protein
VREGLYQSVGEAFGRAEIPWMRDDLEDRGDGIFVLLPPEVPKSLIVELLPSALVAELTAHNRTHPHRHELDRGDAEALQIADHGRVGQPRIGAPKLGRYLRVGPGQAADMDLVDDRVGVRDLRVPVLLPVEGRIFDYSPP